MDKIILETDFDGITQENGGNAFREKLYKYVDEKLNEVDLIAAINALAQKVKKYQPLRHSEGYNIYFYAIYRVRDSLREITNKNFIIPIINWIKSIFESGWTAANADFLLEVCHFLPREYFSSMTKPQLKEHFGILDFTDFQYSAHDDADNRRYVSDMQSQFTRNLFFDYIESKLKEESKEIYQDFLKTLYLKCWSKDVESINIYSRMIGTINRAYSDLYSQTADQFVEHFEEITTKIIKENVPTKEGQMEIKGFFSHNSSILESNKEVQEKIMNKWILALLNIYKVTEIWTISIIETLVRYINLSNLSKIAFDNCSMQFDEFATFFFVIIENRPVSEDQNVAEKMYNFTTEKCYRLLDTISSNYFKNAIKTSEQFEKVVPSLLKLVHYNDNDSTKLYNNFLRNIEKLISNYFKAKPELINQFINQFITTAMLFGESEDTTEEFPFSHNNRNLHNYYDTIKTLGKTTRAFSSPVAQENFRIGFMKVFNNFSLCGSQFIKNFYEFLLFKDYSPEDMLEFIQCINKTISLDLFHIYNPLTFTVSSLFSNLVEFISKSMKKYSSSVEEISKSIIIILRFDSQWDYNGELQNKPSSMFFISVFGKFLLNKPESDIVLLFYPLLLKVIDKTDESNGFYSTWISYLFSSPINMTSPEILSPYIGNIINVGEKIINTDLHSNISIMIMTFNSICKPNPSCLLPYLTNLESLLYALEDDSSSFMMMIGLFSLVYTNFPEKMNDSVVQKIAAKMNVDLGTACQVAAFLVIISKNNTNILLPFISEMYSCIKTYKSSVTTTILNILTNILQHDPKLGEDIFKSLVEITEENTNDTMFINILLYGMKSLGHLRHDLLVKLKENIERWQKCSTNFQDSCQALLDIIADRSLANLGEDITKQKKVITEVDNRLVKTEVKVDTVEKDVKTHEAIIVEVNKKVDETNEKVEKIEKGVELLDEQVQEIDMKTVSNAPRWTREVSKLMNPESDNDWRLLAARLGYSNDDIRAWSTQSDPCMSLLSEWFAVRRHIEATKSILEQLIEMNLTDVAKIVENALTAAEAVISDDDPVEFVEPPLVFLSYQWAIQEEVKVLRAHLQKAGYRCWMDIGQMGGGDKLYEAIDRGIRGAKVCIACVTEKYSQSPNCKRELNLSISLQKAVIPLQMERMSWPPPGTMGPLLTEYIFIRMFGKPGGNLVEGTFWPKDRFQELLMQIRYSCAPEYDNVTEEYKEWWIIPGVDIKYIVKKEESDKIEKPIAINTERKGPVIFISYQWRKQEEVKNLYQFLTSKGLSCWMDIYQIGGGDSIYDKIDRGVRDCKLMISCVTPKYSESPNCRREVSLCDNLKKPLIPILLEQIPWPPEGPMSMPLTQLINISFVDSPEEQRTWKGPFTNELLRRINQIIPEFKIAVPPSTKQPNLKNVKTTSNSNIKVVINKRNDKTSTVAIPQARKQSVDNVNKRANSNTQPKRTELGKYTDKVPPIFANSNKSVGSQNKAVYVRSTSRPKPESKT